MTTAEIIAEMRGLMAYRRQLCERLTEAGYAAEGTGGPISGLPRGTGQESRVEHYGTVCADLGREMDAIDRKLAMYSEDVRRPIEAIPDKVDALVLKLRYVERLSVKQVAKKMHYDRTAMYRRLQKAEDRWIF